MAPDFADLAPHSGLGGRKTAALRPGASPAAARIPRTAVAAVALAFAPNHVVDAVTVDGDLKIIAVGKTESFLALVSCAVRAI